MKQHNVCKKIESISGWTCERREDLYRLDIFLDTDCSKHDQIELFRNVCARRLYQKQILKASVLKRMVFHNNGRGRFKERQ